jgi:hypothetical protein
MARAWSSYKIENATLMFIGEKEMVVKTAITQFKVRCILSFKLFK